MPNTLQLNTFNLSSNEQTNTTKQKHTLHVLWGKKPNNILIKTQAENLQYLKSFILAFSSPPPQTGINTYHN